MISLTGAKQGAAEKARRTHEQCASIAAGAEPRRYACGNLVDERHPRGSGGRKITFIGVIGALFVVKICSKLRNQKVQVRIPLAMCVSRHVDGHVVDFKREITAMVQVEGAKK